MNRHPMWRPSRSRLCAFVRAAQCNEQALARVSVAVALLLFSMMILRVLIAWADGRL